MIRFMVVKFGLVMSMLMWAKCEQCPTAAFIHVSLSIVAATPL